MSSDKFKNKAKGIMDGLEDDKNKNSKEDKSKRSFSLTENQVEKI